jgi:hypothetical protein
MHTSSGVDNIDEYRLTTVEKADGVHYQQHGLNPLQQSSGTLRDGELARGLLLPGAAGGTHRAYLQAGGIGR